MLDYLIALFRLWWACRAFVRTEPTVGDLLEIWRETPKGKESQSTDAQGQIQNALKLAPLLMPWLMPKDLQDMERRALAAYHILGKPTERIPAWLLTDTHPLDAIRGVQRGGSLMLLRLHYLESQRRQVPRYLRHAASRLKRAALGDPDGFSLFNLSASVGLSVASDEMGALVDFVA